MLVLQAHVPAVAPLLSIWGVPIRASLLNNPMSLRARPSRWYTRHLRQQVLDLEQLTSSPTDGEHGIRSSLSRQPTGYH